MFRGSSVLAGNTHKPRFLLNRIIHEELSTRLIIDRSRGDNVLSKVWAIAHLTYLCHLDILKPRVRFSILTHPSSEPGGQITPVSLQVLLFAASGKVSLTSISQVYR